jgi:hypothetical protein
MLDWQISTTGARTMGPRPALSTNLPDSHIALLPLDAVTALLNPALISTSNLL